MKTALVIPIFNRSSYVKQCFASLAELTVKPDLYVLVDDYSTDAEIPQIIAQFVIANDNTIAYRQQKNTGVRGALLWGIDKAFNSGADIVINLDSDAVVKPDFIDKLLQLHSLYGTICSGFNNPKEPFIQNGFKKHANGINMCFNREQYDNHIRPALLARSGNWDYMASESAGKVKVSVPSCVQHIGTVSSMGHIGADKAHDFNIIQLPDVTLFGIDSHDITGIKRAAEISGRSIRFATTNIITDDLFTKGGNSEQRRKDYSKFMFKELTKHFDTSHVLTIHADGYVVNADAWDNSWLEYDYIGATWWYKDNMNVGNGGFSLRSKKLCDILAYNELEGQQYHPEDHHICRTYRASLEALGVKFAPEEVANKFSIEAYNVAPPYNRYNGQFGFHGVHVDMSPLPEDVRYKKVQPASRIQQIKRR